MSEPVGVKIARLRNRVEAIEERLSRGWELIDARRESGIDVTELEDFWIDLLKEYESAVEELGRHE